jgi:hypothetical protein
MTGDTNYSPTARYRIKYHEETNSFTVECRTWINGGWGTWATLPYCPRDKANHCHSRDEAMARLRDYNTILLGEEYIEDCML